MIALSANIKKHRLEKEMTQTQLASVFNVSEQAVSRWENGNTYPDIQLLPAIADYFGITIDELMGMESYKDERETDKIIALVKENERKGLIGDNVKILQDAVVKYPKNYVILNFLVNQLNFEWCDDETKMRANHEKAIEIADRILDECTDQIIRNTANFEKINSLELLGRTEEAIELAEKLPLISMSYEFKLKDLYTGEKLKLHCKEALMAYAQNMYSIVQRMSDLGFQDESMSIEDRISVCKKSLEILNVVYEGEYGNESWILAKTHRYIAAMTALIGKTEETLYHLEEAAKYAVLHDTLPEKQTLHSTLLSGYEVKKASLFKSHSFTECGELFDRLKQERYDIVRDTERFKAVLGKITPYVDDTAKQN